MSERRIIEINSMNLTEFYITCRNERVFAPYLHIRGNICKCSQTVNVLQRVCQCTKLKLNTMFSPSRCNLESRRCVINNMNKANQCHIPMHAYRSTQG